MVKKLSSQQDRIRYGPEHELLKPRGKAGRPASPTTKAPRKSVPLTTLRKVYQALDAAHNAPRLASTKELVYSAAKDLARAVGAALAEDYAPPAPRPGHKGPAPKAVAYHVVLADGTEHVVPTLEQAATLYGCQPNSLRAMLARGGKGLATRRCWHEGSRSSVSCRRVEKLA